MIDGRLDVLFLIFLNFIRHISDLLMMLQLIAIVFSLALLPFSKTF